MSSESRRPAHLHRFEVPTRPDLAGRLARLIRDARPAVRSEIASWAAEYVVYDEPQVYPEIEDEVVWKALCRLSGADMPTTDRPFLYGPKDFTAWLADVLVTDGKSGSTAPAS